MIEVNLLPAQNVLSQKEKEWRRYLILAAAGGGVLTALALFLIFLGQGFFTIRAGLLSRQRAGLEAQLQQEAETLKTVQIINDKVAGIKAIRNAQINFSEILNKLSALVDKGAKIKNVGLSSDGKVQFQAEVPNSVTLKIILETLSASDSSRYFTPTVISSLQESENKTLSFFVETKFHE